MGISKFLQDIFEHINFLDKNLENPFLNSNNQSNPFSKFYNGTYVWIEPNDEE